LASAWRSSALLGACALALGATAPGASAGVFMTQADALAWAFPDADHVDRKSFALSDEQLAKVEALAQSKLDSRLVTLYTGLRGGQVLGYAVIDLHTVRTQTGAFLVVIGPDGKLVRLRVIAFHEPQEYLPPERWLAQFEGKQAGDPLRVDHEVHGIAGATLSSQAVTGAVRRSLALQAVLLGPGGG